MGRSQARTRFPLASQKQDLPIDDPGSHSAQRPAHRRATSMSPRSLHWKSAGRHQTRRLDSSTAVSMGMRRCAAVGGLHGLGPGAPTPFLARLRGERVRWTAGACDAISSRIDSGRPYEDSRVPQVQAAAGVPPTAIERLWTSKPMMVVPSCMTGSSYAALPPPGGNPRCRGNAPCPGFTTQDLTREPVTP